MTEPRDAYKVLQVDPEADLEVIQAAYRRLAQKYHPDRVTAPDEAASAATRMVELNSAWDQLRDPDRRSAYDRKRAVAATQAAAAPTSSPGPTARPSPPFRPTPPPTSRPPGPPPSRPSGPSGWSPSPPPASGPFPSSVGPEPTGSAGPPPGRPSGSVLNFGRYAGWSLGEIARSEPAYLEWLDRMPIGRPYRAELDVLLRSLGRRGTEQAEAAERRGLFRRR